MKNLPNNILNSFIFNIFFYIILYICLILTILTLIIYCDKCNYLDAQTQNSNKMLVDMCDNNNVIQKKQSINTTGLDVTEGSLMVDFLVIW